MSRTYPPYSVLLPVYHRDNPADLRESIESMLAQTIAPSDFVIVCDGPLTDELDRLLNDVSRLADVIRVLRLPENRGLGIALSAGLDMCLHELVARMDADDIAVPDRARLQLDCFLDNPGVDIVSGAVEEFQSEPRDLSQARRLPETHDELVRFAKMRNPFNHPCVMYKKSSVIRAGGYQDFFRLEDYFLWVRMLQNGSQGMNSPDVLLHMRIGNGMYRRRSGMQYARSQAGLLGYMRRTNFITVREFFKGLAIRIPMSLVPDRARKFAFERVLRVRP
ncbi:glycosyltransferase [Actinomycetaceae bacterium L2_0104]